MALLRISKSLNQTGVKWRDLPDLSDALHQLFSPAHHLLFLIVSIVGPCCFWTSRSLLPLHHKLLLLSSAVAVWASHAAPMMGSIKPISDTHLLLLQRAAWMLLGLGAIVLRREKALLAVVTLALQLISRWTNAPLLALFQAVAVLLHSPRLSDALLSSVGTSMRATLTLHVAAASYFMMGNSNSLASIDFTGAYVGLAEYNQLVVGLLTGVAMYAGPILFCSTSLLFGAAEHRWVLLRVTLLLLSLSSLSSQLAFLWFQHHLFVWSVFAPKAIFVIAHTSCAFSLLLLPLLLHFVKTVKSAKPPI